MLLTGACSGGDESGKPTVVTSVYPLGWLVEQIGGDRIEAVDLTPPGVEPHDLELSASQVVELTEADLVVHLGAGFQPAIDDALDDAGGTVLDALGVVPSGADASDPHIWLAPENMAVLAARVASRLTEIDPEGERTFIANAETTIGELAELQADFNDGLASCERRVIIVSHEAFGHLAAAYDLEQIGIAGIDPEAEPSPARLAEVEELAREHGVTHIFFEELVSPATAETLADELGIEAAVLSPLESRPAEGDYLDRMRANLMTLREALSCE